MKLLSQSNSENIHKEEVEKLEGKITELSEALHLKEMLNVELNKQTQQQQEEAANGINKL